mmetsp:Transcript_71541/g.141869  ORF Transcript_71541/g.141869 Transcript_71541/m.141869 type:complete len:260 (+) Transcript_71541:1039-1818(+)
MSSTIRTARGSPASRSLWLSGRTRQKTRICPLRSSSALCTFRRRYSASRRSASQSPTRLAHAKLFTRRSLICARRLESGGLSSSSRSLASSTRARSCSRDESWAACFSSKASARATSVSALSKPASCAAASAVRSCVRGEPGTLGGSLGTACSGPAATSPWPPTPAGVRGVRGRGVRGEEPSCCNTFWSCSSFWSSSNRSWGVSPSCSPMKSCKAASNVCLGVPWSWTSSSSAKETSADDCDIELVTSDWQELPFQRSG